MFNLKEAYQFYEYKTFNDIKRTENLISDLTDNKNNIIATFNKNKSSIEKYYSISLNELLNNLTLVLDTDKIASFPLFNHWVQALKSIESKLVKLEKKKLILSRSLVTKEIFTKICETYMMDYIHPTLIHTGRMYVSPNVSISVRKHKNKVGIDWAKSLQKRKELEAQGIPIRLDKENKQGEDWLVVYENERNIKINVSIRHSKNRENYKYKMVISQMYNYDPRRKKLVYVNHDGTETLKNNEDFIKRFTYDEILNLNLNLYRKLILLTTIEPKLLKLYDK